MIWQRPRDKCKTCRHRTLREPAPNEAQLIVKLRNSYEFLQQLSAQTIKSIPLYSHSTHIQIARAHRVSNVRTNKAKSFSHRHRLHRYHMCNHAKCILSRSAEIVQMFKAPADAGVLLFLRTFSRLEPTTFSCSLFNVPSPTDFARFDLKLVRIYTPVPQLASSDFFSR